MLIAPRSAGVHPVQEVHNELALLAVFFLFVVRVWVPPTQHYLTLRIGRLLAAFVPRLPVVFCWHFLGARALRPLRVVLPIHLREIHKLLRMLDLDGVLQIEPGRRHLHLLEDAVLHRALRLRAPVAAE